MEPLPQALCLSAEETSASTHRGIPLPFWRVQGVALTFLIAFCSKYVSVRTVIKLLTDQKVLLTFLSTYQAAPTSSILFSRYLFLAQWKDLQALKVKKKVFFFFKKKKGVVSLPCSCCVYRRSIGGKPATVCLLKTAHHKRKTVLAKTTNEVL